MGLMPHPEHAVDPLLGSGDGALILASLLDAARERSQRQSRSRSFVVRPLPGLLAPPLEDRLFLAASSLRIFVL